MGWAFREFIHKIGADLNPNPPCSVGMDVTFIFDYTGSMGGVIETAKTAAADIVTAIDTEVGAGNYRLGLITADEVSNGGAVNYSTSTTYTTLPAPQRYFNSGTGVDQYITALTMFSANNEGSFQAQLNSINEPLPLMPLGSGVGGPEPTDVALDLVINSDFLGQLRLNVAKYILIFTDNVPGGTDDTSDGTDQAAIDALEAQCIAKGVKVFVIGNGASFPIWQGIATNTGGFHNTSFDAEVIISAIVAACGDLIPPVANANVDQIVTLPTTSTTLDGSGSTAEGAITDYFWEKISGGTATITTPTSSITTVTGLEFGPYEFKLTVTDDQALQDTDFMAIDVQAGNQILLGTDSVLASWTPTTVLNSGSPLTWDVTGGYVGNQVADTPTFDLSTNTGVADMVVTEVTNVTNFSVDNLGVTYIDVTEATNLEILRFGGGTVSTVDISNNTALTTIYCSNNNLNGLVTTNNTLLESIECSLNSIPSLNVSTNTALRTLSCFNNSLTTLDVTANGALELLQFQNNNVTTIDITNNTALETLKCSSNGMTALNVAVNTALTEISCSTNPAIGTLDVSNNTLLETLVCFNIGISTLDVSANTALTLLRCQNNSLTNLSITNNTLLTTLDCDGNALVSGDIDNILIQLDSNGLSGGTVTIPLGRTSASDAAKASLQGKSWTVTEV